MGWDLSGRVEGTFTERTWSVYSRSSRNPEGRGVVSPPHLSEDNEGHKLQGEIRVGLLEPRLGLRSSPLLSGMRCLVARCLRVLSPFGSGMCVGLGSQSDSPVRPSTRFSTSVVLPIYLTELVSQ